MDFNQKSIERTTCPPGQSAVYLRDKTTRGLYAQIAQKGTKTFVYRRKVKKLDGKETYRQRSIGAVDEITIPEARKKAEQFTADLNKGVEIFDEKPPAYGTASATDPTVSTFRSLFDHYMENKGNKKKTGRNGVMTKDFERWFGKSLAGIDAALITYKDASRRFKELSAVSEYSANRAVQLGRAVYNFALKTREYRGENPFVGIELNKETPRDRVLSMREAGELLSALKAGSIRDKATRRVTHHEDSDKDLIDVVSIELYTGARKANVLAMRWEDIDFDENVWTIPGSETKNGKEHKVWLTPIEVRILNERREYLKLKQGAIGIYVFPGTGKTGHLADPKRSWKTLREKLNLWNGEKRLRMHDVRRSLGSTMANENVNMTLISQNLNQKDLATTHKHYANANAAAQLHAKQLAHAAWLEAERKLEEDDNETET